MTNQAKREHLIETAQRLFSRNGYHGTGIDMILKESGVAKKTLYYHFQSKEDLIVEVLKRYDEQFSVMVDRKVNQLADNPKDRLLAIFDVAHEWFSDKHFYGCMFINAIGEYSHTDSSIRDACKGFKKKCDNTLSLCVLKLELSIQKTFLNNWRCF
jgi:Transcriptional regulator